MTAIWVFLGGGLGAVCRWGLNGVVDSLATKLGWGRFPVGILGCNLLGCFLIGWLFGYYAGRQVPGWVFPFLATGFLGGFTTFSTFGKNTQELWAGGLGGLALVNVVASVVLGLGAVLVGLRVAQG